MIDPDDKDWTWVLREPCPDCGFDASTCLATEVADLIRGNARAWEALLSEGAIRPGEPGRDRWSGLEYACHVRDVYRRYDERVRLMLEQDDPWYENWDQDVTAVEDRYDEQDPATVVDELVVAAEAMAQRFDGVDAAGWERTGRRGEHDRFTVDTISRYLVHDPIHHVWDVSGRRAGA